MGPNVLRLRPRLHQHGIASQENVKGRFFQESWLPARKRQCLPPFNCFAIFVAYVTKEADGSQVTDASSSRLEKPDSDRLFRAVNTLIYASHPYLTYRFKDKVGYYPNVACPRRYHVKVYWRKVFDRNPAFPVFCDKLQTKAWFRQRVPSLNVVEPIWIGTELDKTALDMLAGAQVVLKGNHGSGFNLFPADFSKGMPHVGKATQRWMSRNFARRYYQPAYRRAERTLFIEPLISNGGAPLVDYYVRAAMGKVLLVSVLINAKRDGQKYGYFGEAAKRLTHLEPAWSRNTLPPDFVPPPTFAAAMAHAREISREFDYLRIDFMSTRLELFAGEITVYPNAGMTWADDNPANDINAVTSAGWDIRNSHFFSQQQPSILELYKHRLATALEWTDRLAK
jgi:hypothetical protein